MIRREDKDIANEHPFAKKAEPERIELAAKDKKKTLKDLLGKDFKSTGLIKILPNETIDQAIKRLLKKQRKRSN